MALEHLELVRSVLAAWEQGDYRSLAWADPEVELVIADGPAPRRWTGLDGMAAGWRELRSAWTNLRGEAEEYLILDDERVLVLVRLTAGQGKASGVEVERVRPEGAALFHVRDGQVTKLAMYWHRKRAFLDCGLPPDTGQPG